MMRPFGQAGLALLVALTACALTAGSASAAHFEPAKVNFTTTSGASVIYANATPSIKCSSDKGTGGVTSLEGLSWVSFIFEGCKSSVPCIKSLGFEALSGQLGNVALAEAGSLLGVMLTFNSTIECGTETVKLKGTVAGEFEPRAFQATHNLNFNVVSGVQKIKTINIGGTAIKPMLEVLLNSSTSSLAALESNESNTFANSIEGVL